jgi:hypothetical protein
VDASAKKEIAAVNHGIRIFLRRSSQNAMIIGKKIRTAATALDPRSLRIIESEVGIAEKKEFNRQCHSLYESLRSDRSESLSQYTAFLKKIETKCITPTPVRPKTLAIRFWIQAKKIVMRNVLSAFPYVPGGLMQSEPYSTR